MRFSVLSTSLLLLGASLAMVSPAGAEGVGGTAPSYPGNTISLAATAPVVAGQAMTVKLLGRTDWGGATSQTTTSYSLSLYVQNADVDPHCAHGYGAQLQKTINLPLNASVGISGWVIDESLAVFPEPPAPSLDWSVDSFPFAIRTGVSKVVLCAFQRNIIDDVAWYELPLQVAQPSACNPAGTKAAAAKVRHLKKAVKKAGPAKAKKLKKRLKVAKAKLKAARMACAK